MSSYNLFLCSVCRSSPAKRTIMSNCVSYGALRCWSCAVTTCGSPWMLRVISWPIYKRFSLFPSKDHWLERQFLSFGNYLMPFYSLFVLFPSQRPRKIALLYQGFCILIEGFGASFQNNHVGVCRQEEMSS